MEILNNEENCNHLQELIELCSMSSEMLCVSPFLMTDFSEIFKKTGFSELKSFHVITTLRKDEDQYEKVKSFRNLFHLSHKLNFNLTISIDNNLHGKVYIGSKNEKIKGAIITSANFTNAGLCKNHEWGVYIDNIDMIDSMMKTIKGDIMRISIEEDDVKKMENMVAENPKPSKPTVDVNLFDSLFPSIPSYASNKTTYWLKPMGCTETPIPLSENFSELEDELHFTKRRPSGIKNGDVIICYGVGLSSILSIYVTKNVPQYSTEDEIIDEPWKERWPWYIRAENQTCEYGAAWATHQLILKSLREEFKKKYPLEKVTFKSDTLGALQWGTDHIKLNPRFACYIIDKVNSCIKY